MIIQDFAFNEYPIAREYFLGGQKIIQIDTSELLRGLEELRERVSDLENDAKLDAKTICDLEDKFWKLQHENTELNDQIDAAFEKIPEVCGFKIDFSDTLAANLSELGSCILTKTEELDYASVLQN